jgi:hypothetical protein
MSYDELNLDFDTAAVEPAEDNYSPIPEGIYEARVDRAEMKPTKDGTGKRLVLMWRIIGPSHRGRTVLVGLNVTNKNEKAQTIARRQLAQLLEAVGLPGERDMARLIDAECLISVTVRPAQNGYEASNDIKRFAPTDDMSTSEATEPATPKAKSTKRAPSFMR